MDHHRKLKYTMQWKDRKRSSSFMEVNDIKADKNGIFNDVESEYVEFKNSHTRIDLYLHHFQN
jgi:hypothetical protein